MSEPRAERSRESDKGLKKYINSKYNIFSASNVWNTLKTINRTSVTSLKKLWGTKKESWITTIGLFIPRVLGSIGIAAAHIGTSTVTAGIGAITAGIIGGAVQTIWGGTKLLTGGVGGIIGAVLIMAPFNKGPYRTAFWHGAKKLFLSGAKDFLLGSSKFVIGSVVAGAIAFSIASAVGAPAAAALTSIALAGNSLHFLTTIASAMTTVNTFLVNAGISIASVGGSAAGIVGLSTIGATGMAVGAVGDVIARNRKNKKAKHGNANGVDLSMPPLSPHISTPPQQLAQPVTPTAHATSSSILPSLPLFDLALPSLPASPGIKGDGNGMSTSNYHFHQGNIDSQPQENRTSSGSRTLTSTGVHNFPVVTSMTPMKEEEFTYVPPKISGIRKPMPHIPHIPSFPENLQPPPLSKISNQEKEKEVHIATTHNIELNRSFSSDSQATTPRSITGPRSKK